MSIVSKYLDENKEVLLRDNPRRNESWLANEHMRKSSDTQISEYLKKLARGRIFIVVTYQGYAINGYTFYTEEQDKKSTYQNSNVCVDAYDVTGQDTMVKYKRSGNLTFTISRFPFSIATGLMQSRVLYKTSTCSLALTLTVKDIRQSLSC
jgi:hypothetical protein